MLLHNMIKWSCRKNYSRFNLALEHPELAQKQVLKNVLKHYSNFPVTEKLLDDFSYENFKNKMPITSFEDWQFLISEQKKHKKETVSRGVIKYEPTSGSTSYIKWIPYTKKLKKELDHASSAWLYDLYLREPGIKYGKHYWSLSWLPNDLRGKKSSDDTQIFPWHKRLFLKQVMVVDETISQKTTSQEALLETALCLCSANTSLISVWSPTFLLEILNFIFKHKNTLLGLLEEKKSYKQVQILSQHHHPSSHFTKEMWPNLSVISCWQTSTSHFWYLKLKNLFPQVSFQGKGLWATEGVVTIPFAKKYPLAINSHFYEFICLDSGEVLPSWQLEIDQRVKPVITTGSGLMRYMLNDELVVTDYLKKTPCFKFMGRINEVDIAGEKINQSVANELIDHVKKNFSLEGVSLLAYGHTDSRYYELVVIGKENTQVDFDVDVFLQKWFHYRLARELGQLKRAKMTVRPDAITYYQKKVLTGEVFDGSLKIESLKLVSGVNHE